MLFKSIRFRLVLWYMLLLSVTLLLLGLVLYHNFSHNLKRNMDDLLRSKADGITESIDTYWEAERLETDKDIPASVFNKENKINFLKIAERWVNEKTTDPAFISFSVHIFDSYGHPVASSKNIPVPVLSEKIFRDIFHGRKHYEDWKTFRTLTTPVIENNRLVYIVQVASPVAPMRTALHNLSLLLILLLPFTVILTGVAGAFLARVALNPVHKMIETIRQITAENLKLRIDLPQNKDEIHALAVTFNEMLIRLDDAFTSQRQFMEDISHELKTPLAILKGELEVTLKKVRSAAEYETTLASSLEEVNRLVGIVENLLTLARFDTKTITLQPEPFDLNDLIQSVLDDIRVLARQKKVTLDFDCQRSFTIKADRSQMRRLLLNLLDNAVKYTPEGGRVSLSIWQEEHFIKIAISDTGKGIPAQELPHIFDRFYRVDKARTDTGSGLGLSIAKSIIEAHNGRIDVKATLHQGSTFTVLLPAL